MTVMRVVVAPDKFKGSLTAAQVAEALARGMLDVRPDLDVVCRPVADGGDGTLAAALGAGFERVDVTAVGPTGLPVHTAYALDGARAVVELADVVGLARLPGGRPEPLTASTFGLGLVIGDAIDRGATDIVLGVGGSASTDGGAGLVQALGASLTDRSGRELAPGGAALAGLDAVDLRALRARLGGIRVVVACDVDNPLLGSNGAATVFGPQKGASAADIGRLEAGLATWARVVAETTGIDVAGTPGAGAAGGTGFVALALLGAGLRPGIDLVLDLVHFGDAVAGADLVVTGEGSLDEQSLSGKAPVGVARAAQGAGSPVVAVAGRNLLSPDQLAGVGIARAYPLAELEPDVAASMANAAALLRRVGATIAEDWLVGDDTGYDLVLRGGRVMTSEGEVAAEVGVRHGRVAAIEPLGSRLVGARVMDLADDEVLLPGLVDTHVHVNEPGRTEWEGFASATRAAAAGGVTTIVDMPLNSIPPTCDVPALELKQAAAATQAFVDVGFWGGAVPGNVDQLRTLHDAGVFGFKCFLLPSGVDEFPHLEADEMEADMAVLAGFDSLMIVHAEDSRTIEEAPEPQGQRYDRFLASRPRGAENVAVAEVIERARRTGVRAHVLHLSSSDALPLIRAAKRDGIRLTVETCPHYLTLVSDEIPDGASAYKCCPPIRESANRELLWEGLQDGTIDCIVSDHSPTTLDVKDVENGDFGVAWGGVSSLQLGLSLVWTEARRRGIGLDRVVEWMGARPAELVRLTHKGRLAVGSDADLSVFAPDETYVVDPARLHHKNPVTPYAGRTLSGVVRRTYLRGREIDSRTPSGELLRSG